MNTPDEPIAIQTAFTKATTLVDGGWRITFDCGEDSASKIADLSKLKHENLFLVVMTEEQYSRMTNA